mgnify:CR=1 FL=1
MGQHKYNPTAIAAKKGEIPPKPKKIGAREMDRLIQQKFNEELDKRGLNLSKYIKKFY